MINYPNNLGALAQILLGPNKIAGVPGQPQQPAGSGATIPPAGGGGAALVNPPVPPKPADPSKPELSPEAVALENRLGEYLERVRKEREAEIQKRDQAVIEGMNLLTQAQTAVGDLQKKPKVQEKKGGGIKDLLGMGLMALLAGAMGDKNGDFIRGMVGGYTGKIGADNQKAMTDREKEDALELQRIQTMMGMGEQKLGIAETYGKNAVQFGEQEGAAAKAIGDNELEAKKIATTKEYNEARVRGAYNNDLSKAWAQMEKADSYDAYKQAAAVYNSLVKNANDEAGRPMFDPLTDAGVEQMWAGKADVQAKEERRKAFPVMWQTVMNSVNSGKIASRRLGAALLMPLANQAIELFGNNPEAVAFYTNNVNAALESLKTELTPEERIAEANAFIKEQTKDGEVKRVGLELLKISAQIDHIRRQAANVGKSGGGGRSGGSSKSGAPAGVKSSEVKSWVDALDKANKLMGGDGSLLGKESQIERGVLQDIVDIVGQKVQNAARAAGVKVESKGTKAGGGSSIAGLLQMAGNSKKPEAKPATDPRKGTGGW